MKTLFRILLVVGILVALGVPAYFGGLQYWKSVTKVNWRTAEVTRGKIVSVVNSTGTVKPKEKIIIGAFVSGPLLPKQLPDFNDVVTAGQVLAEIDPMIYDANVNRDKANYDSRLADVSRVKAQLQQAINDERRALDLKAEDPTFIAQAEMDQFKFARMGLDAQLIVAEASAKQAKESYKYSETQRAYTEIKAPKDGIIINRKIEPGQTLASQFTAPELFEIGVGMREEMQIHASVDETDIGRIIAAQDKQLPVSFTVEAYPDALFHGVIDQIRLNSTSTQNVVTYPVVVKTANPDLKLLPGMTAAISFQVDERKDVVKIPNSALRFFPLPKQVRKEDIPILEGTQVKDDGEEAQQSETTLSAEERAENRRKRNRRHVWVQEGDLLKAVEVVVGLTDSQFTEMVSGSLQAGAQLVIGIQQPQYGR
jgi:HlyD family secretion protein